MRGTSFCIALSLLGCSSQAKPTPTVPPLPPTLARVEQSSAPPAPLNQLFNGGFESDWYNRSFAEQRRFLLLQASDIGMAEQDGQVDHWTLTEADPTKYWDLKVAHQGQRSLHFEGPGQAHQRLRWVGENGWEVGGAHYGGFLPMAAGLARQLRSRPIMIGAWCRSQGAGAAPRLRVEMQLQQRPKVEDPSPGPATQLSRSVDFEAGSHDWQYREIVVQPADVPGSAHFLQVWLEAPAGSVWFDDVSVAEKLAPDEVNLVPNGGFEVVQAEQASGWSPPQLWGWMRNEYYSFTGWTHEKTQKWRGSAALDRLVHWDGEASLRFEVFPGDNFAVAGPPILLHQKQVHPLEVRAMVRADQIRTVEIMAQDDQGHWLPQGDFLGDDMEDNPSLYNMGTTGSGCYDWVCLRKFFSPRKPLSSVRLFLCARGFDGVRVAKNLVGTVWWDDVQLYQHGDEKPRPAPSVGGTPVQGFPGRVTVDLGERLYGDNQFRVTCQPVPKECKVRLRLQAPGGKSQTSEADVNAEGVAQLPYRVDRLCTDASQQYRLHLEMGSPPLAADYAFGTPTHLVECETDHFFAYPDEKIEIFARLNLTRRELARTSRLELIDLTSGRKLRSSSPAEISNRPQLVPDFVDGSRSWRISLGSQENTVHPWAEPVRDLGLALRLYSADQLLAQSATVAVGFLQKIPPADFPARITSTGVDERSYLRINGKPYFPVYWTPNFDRPFEGNYPPRLFGYPSADVNDQPRDKVLQKVAETQANSKFFAYELGDGEMQLQGASWLVRLQAVKAAIGWIRQADPHHLINGPESWLIGHPGHNDAMKAFLPYFDVIGVETSFEEVPEARRVRGSARPCAVLAGLEAYFYQPVESLRWRGYRAIYEGCSGVGLCPSEMLKAKPAHLTYLRGLNAEFRGLESVFTAVEPTPRVSADPGVQCFERVMPSGRHYLFAMTAPGVTGFPRKVSFRGVNGKVKVRGEARTLDSVGGVVSDSFGGPYTVHVYEY